MGFSTATEGSDLREGHGGHGGLARLGKKGKGREEEEATKQRQVLCTLYPVHVPLPYLIHARCLCPSVLRFSSLFFFVFSSSSSFESTSDIQIDRVQQFGSLKLYRPICYPSPCYLGHCKCNGKCINHSITTPESLA